MRSAIKTVASMLRNTRRRYLIVLLILLIIQASQAQEAGPQRGFKPGSSFALSEIENINMTNGNMMMNFPLGPLPAGRNGLTAAINLLYNNKNYNSRTSWFEDNGKFNCGLQPCYYQKTELGFSNDGGWRYGLGYFWEITDRVTDGSLHPQSQCTLESAYLDLTYRYKLRLIFPDGSSHEMRPNGFSDNNGNDPAGDYYNVTPDGWISDCAGNGHWHSNSTMYYYSTDGSFLRLDIQRGGSWTLNFPDGTKVVMVVGGQQRVYDRNNNYLQMDWVENYQNTGLPATVLSDQLNRTAVLTFDPVTGEDVIRVQGFGQELVWRVHWNTIRVWRTYWPCPEGTLQCQTGDTGTSQYQIPQQYTTNFFVVDQISLPQQAGTLSYNFSYNAPFQPPGWPPPTSTGWGELNGVTLPSGAQANYQFALDNYPDPLTPEILRNSPTQKDLVYMREYDGTSTQVTDTWNYGFGFGSGSVTGPDGGTTSHSAVYAMNCWYWNCGLTTAIVQPDGTKIERIWAKNNLISYGSPTAARGDNPYIKTEFTSIKDAGGTYVKTSIKDYKHDKNGNVTRVAEYDWFPYASIPRDSGGFPTGIPGGAVPVSITTNTYQAPTPDATQETTNGNVYWFQSAPQYKNAGATTEVSSGSGAVVSRDEYSYDNALTTGNLTQTKVWDSIKGPYSNPLLATNSNSVTNQYSTWSNGNTGKLTQTTDARGFITRLTYGLVGGFEIYPTQTETAFGTSVQKTQTREYDLNTGLVTRVTDVENNVLTSSTYDAFGRATLTRTAEGKPEESRTTSEYSDVNRRVIVRSDLNEIGDGKLVSIQHYDQLGRVRLSRKLEDSATQIATDETAGIKVQTRYAYSGSNSFVMTSNPYRAASSNLASSEPTMGWSRNKSDNDGQLIEAQTFGGAGLPAPWGTNANSTGSIVTAYSANEMTITDQAGKQKKSITDALGRLVQVYEDPTLNGFNYLTSYVYDPVDNLKTITQGAQTRTFVYDSLKRLSSATNPESGTVSYQYDENSNVRVKTDARGVSVHYEYDGLNRPVRRWYNGSSLLTQVTHNSPALPAAVGATDEVKYHYDSQTLPSGSPTFDRGYASGRMVAVTYGGGSTGNFFGYDALGRVLRGIQRIGSANYQTTTAYNFAGGVNSKTYPSGRIVTNGYDNAGRLNSFTGNLGDGNTRTYATGIGYSALGRMTIEQFGTQTALYHKLQHNVRGQLWDVRVSTGADVNGSWNRGCLQFFYDNSGGFGTSGPENNGNVLKSWHYIPLNEQTTAWAIQRDTYAYDSLNRIKSVSESYISNTESENTKFVQSYTYDPYGNRTINAALTWGVGINNTGFEIDPAGNNRLLAPGDSPLPEASRRMQYDQAGNLKSDTYTGPATGQGTRTYDAENRMTASGGSSPATYVYDGDGRRVKRIVGTTETWMIYGLGGELIAEYAVNGSPSAPQKEYGYRNGQLLITASMGGTGWGAAPSFQENPLDVGVTIVRSTHITELRSAIDAVRSHYNLSAYNWQTAAAPGNSVTIAPIQEMRTALDQALGLPAGGYASGLASGQLILKIHIQELRDRILSAWQSGSSVDIRWLVSDQLGTPRIIVDLTGNLASVSRHDYLPFGEELTTQGVRSPQLGYIGDTTRHRFTSKERDTETGLDYFGARYYSPVQGRFTSADPLFYTASRPGDPQQFNLYGYVRNNPLKLVDPDGKDGKVVAETPQDLEATRRELKRIAPGTKVDSNGKIHKPGFFRRMVNRLTGHGAGTDLVSRIADSKKTVVINASATGTGSSGVASEMTKPALATRFGVDPKDFGYVITFDTKTRESIEVRNPDGTISADTASPGEQLAHELIHAEQRLRSGPLDSAPATHTFSDGGTNRQERATASEFRAVGIPGFTSRGDITENQIRRELGLRPRATYNTRKNWEP